MWSSKMDIF